MLLGGDLSAEWSEHPTSVISSLDGDADITPADPERWAHELGCALAVVHALPSERLVGLPSVFDHSGGSPDALKGPLAAEVRSRWAQVTAGRRSSPTPTIGQATSSGVMEGSRASSTGLAGHVVHAASILAGAGLISFSCSTSKSPTSFSGPTKPRSPGRPVTWGSGMAGRPHARTIGSRPGSRTMRPLDGPTCTNTSFGDATRDGRPVSWNKPSGMIAERRAAAPSSTFQRSPTGLRSAAAAGCPTSSPTGMTATDRLTRRR